PALVAQCRATYPHLEVVESDILGLDPGEVGTFDLVVVVGNVLIYLAEGTERAVLARIRSLLAPGGRVLAGFHPVDGPTNSRAYPPEELVADAEASGLRVDLRAGGYQLQPPEEGYAVWVLSRDDERPGARTHTTPFSDR
ncbi:MAG: class I SAM-dependent methyltransferase, partial [Nocardioides sp.]